MKNIPFKKSSQPVRATVSNPPLAINDSQLGTKQLIYEKKKKIFRQNVKFSIILKLD